MKRLNLFLSLALFALAATLVGFGKVDYTNVFAPPAIGTSYRHTYTLDTITNGENDTLYFPSSWGKTHSNFQALYHIERTNISGTTTVQCILEEANADRASRTAATDWQKIDSLGATTATLGRIARTDLYGVHHRLIVDGRATQSSSYRVHLTLKKKQ